MTRRRGIDWGGVATWAGVALVLVWTFLPIAWAVLASFKPDQVQFAIPPVLLFTPVFKHYLTLWQDPYFFRFFANSLVIAVITTAVVLVVGVLAAYAYSHLPLAGRRLSLTALIAVRAMPPVAVVVPLFLIFRSLGLMDTYTGMAALYTSFFASFAVLMLKAFFDEIPAEVDEAAMLDGCSAMQRLRHVHLPLVAPGLAAAAVLTFVNCWNEFFFAFIFTGRTAKTVQVALAAFIGETGIDWGAMTAGATLVMLPSLVLSWLAQRHMARGLTAGSIK